MMQFDTTCCEGDEVDDDSGEMELFDVEKKDIERDGGGLIAFTSSSSKSSLVT